MEWIARRGRTVLHYQDRVNDAAGELYPSLEQVFYRSQVNQLPRDFVVHVGGGRVGLYSPFRRAFGVDRRGDVGRSPRCRESKKTTTVTAVSGGDGQAFRLLRCVICLVTGRERPRRSITSHDVQPMLTANSRRGRVKALFSYRPSRVLCRFVNCPMAVLGTGSRFKDFFIRRKGAVSNVLFYVRKIRVHARYGVNDGSLNDFRLLSRRWRGSKGRTTSQLQPTGARSRLRLNQRTFFAANGGPLSGIWRQDHRGDDCRYRGSRSCGSEEQGCSRFMSSVRYRRFRRSPYVRRHASDGAIFPKLACRAHNGDASSRFSYCNGHGRRRTSAPGHQAISRSSLNARSYGNGRGEGRGSGNGVFCFFRRRLTRSSTKQRRRSYRRDARRNVGASGLNGHKEGSRGRRGRHRGYFIGRLLVNVRLSRFLRREACRRGRSGSVGDHRPSNMGNANGHSHLNCNSSCDRRAPNDSIVVNDQDGNRDSREDLYRVPFLGSTYRRQGDNCAR